jgi:hypothetical protein
VLTSGPAWLALLPDPNVHWYRVTEPPATVPLALKPAAVPVTPACEPEMTGTGAACWIAAGGATSTHCSPGPHTSAPQLVRLTLALYCTPMFEVPRKSPLTRLTVPPEFTPVTMPTWSA